MKKVSKKFVWNKNLLLDSILSISKGKRVLALIGVFILNILCFWLIHIESVFVLVFLAVDCLLWHIVISFLPAHLKYKIANIVLVCFVLAEVIVLVNSIRNPTDMYGNRTLLCTEISPDGSNVAEGYKTEENDDGTFAGSVYVKNTSPNKKHQIVSHEVFEANNIQNLDVYWEGDNILIVNGESIDLNWLKD